jgi:hypothetical protein
MKVVYFDRALTDRAPSVIGAFCIDPGAKWITLVDIMGALDRGEPVEIRPASETERERAQGLAVIGGIALQLTEVHAAGDAGRPCSTADRRLCDNIHVLRGIGLELAAPLLGLLDSSVHVAPTGYSCAEVL